MDGARRETPGSAGRSRPAAASASAAANAASAGREAARQSPARLSGVPDTHHAAEGTARATSCSAGLRREWVSCKVAESRTGSWCSLVSTLDCQSRGRGFKSRRARHAIKRLEGGGFGRPLRLTLNLPNSPGLLESPRPVRLACRRPSLSERTSPAAAGVVTRRSARSPV